MDKWGYKKCTCGHKNCNDYFLNFTGPEGTVKLEAAKLIVVAPDLLEIVRDLVVVAYTYNLNNPNKDIQKCINEARKLIRKATK